MSISLPDFPARWPRRRPGRSLACALLLALAACGSEPAPGEAPLAGAAIGGPFELVDSAGETVRWSDFDGKWRMVYFGYAFCPDVCPFDVQRMALGHALFARENPDLADDVQPIFITIDPERDTPAVMGEFTRAFSNDLIGLTGTPDQIAAAAEAFAVYYNKGEVTETGGYLMDHSRAGYLMDRDGNPIALLPVESSAEEVAAELAQWVR